MRGRLRVSLTWRKCHVTSPILSCDVRPAHSAQAPRMHGHNKFDSYADAGWQMADLARATRLAAGCWLLAGVLGHVARV